MKTKKMIGGLILAAALTVGIFYACKKPGGKTQPTTEQNELIAQSNSVTDRSTGTQIFYSKDTTGTNRYYKMTLVWNASGVVSVNRSVITSGYPANTQTWIGVEPGISITKYDSNTSTPEIDSVKVCYAAGKVYYIISFEPTPNGGYLKLNPGPNGGCTGHSCLCGKSKTGCKLTPTSNFAWYCAGCSKCTLIHHKFTMPFDDVFGLDKISRTGYYILEAAGISIIN
jgi:hypothetical protein